jgi:L-threonylcarbamoyladenylate synthase
MQTRVISRNDELAQAARLLARGELVAFPTETVYGLGGDARRDEAVAAIYQAKGRPAGNPVIVHVAGIAEARACAAQWPAVAQQLAERFWPGPLTLILPRCDGLSPLVSAGLATVALRSPNHPMAQDLLHEFGGPIAAPSANRSGFTSPTTAAHVLAELSGRVPLVVDGGPCPIGVESTVLDLTTTPPQILRPGAVTAEMLQAVIGNVATASAVVPEADAAASPGQYSRHYSPHLPAYRFHVRDWPAARTWAQRHGPVALLTWSDEVALAAPHETLRLPADEVGFARVIYAALRDGDEREVKAILTLMPENVENLWAAVADRLRRATVDLPILDL